MEGPTVTVDLWNPKIFSLKGFGVIWIHSLIFSREETEVNKVRWLTVGTQLLNSYGTKVWVFHCQNFDSPRTAAEGSPGYWTKGDGVSLPTPFSLLCSFPQRLCSNFLLSKYLLNIIPFERSQWFLSQRIQKKLWRSQWPVACFGTVYIVVLVGSKDWNSFMFSLHLSCDHFTFKRLHECAWE